MDNEEGTVEVAWIPDPPNPIFLRTLIHKWVQVRAVRDRIFEGILFTVDPVTHSVLLYNENGDETSRVELILGHAVLSLRANLKASSEALPPFEASEFNSTTPSVELEGEMIVKRERLKNWLGKNLLEVEVDGLNLKIPWADDLLILPPYDEKSVISGNEIVMGNVRRLIESMPEEF